MVKIVYFCDKCGKEIHGEVFDICVGTYNKDVTEIEDWDRNELHLCDNCINSILSNIDNKEGCANCGAQCDTCVTESDIWKEIDLPNESANGNKVDLPFCNSNSDFDKMIRDFAKLKSVFNEEVTKANKKAEAKGEVGEATSTTKKDVEKELAEKFKNIATDFSLRDFMIPGKLSEGSLSKFCEKITKDILKDKKV